MTAEVPATIAERISQVQETMAQAARAVARDPAEVRLVAVSKRQPLERLQAAYDAGLRDFGENYVQALLERRPQLPDDVRWHFIGHLQSNKAKQVAWAHLIHALDSRKTAKLLAKTAGLQDQSARALIQVNVSGEDSKSGVSPNDLPALLDDLATCEGIEIRGLMCIPAPDDHDAFRRLRELRDEVASRTDFDLGELSMGMSSSYEEAIKEGATLVRVGTGIFGERTY